MRILVQQLIHQYSHVVEEVHLIVDGYKNLRIFHSHTHHTQSFMVYYGQMRFTKSELKFSTI